MEFSEKGPTDPMNNGHFSPINGLKSVNGIQFSLYGTPTNLIFVHRDVPQIYFQNIFRVILKFSWHKQLNLSTFLSKFENVSKYFRLWQCYIEGIHPLRIFWRNFKNILKKIFKKDWGNLYTILKKH